MSPEARLSLRHCSRLCARTKTWIRDMTSSPVMTTLLKSGHVHILAAQTWRHSVWGATVSDFWPSPERCNRNFADEFSPGWVVRRESRDISERLGSDQGHLRGKRQVAADSSPQKHEGKVGPLSSGEETALTAGGSDGKTTSPASFLVRWRCSSVFRSLLAEGGKQPLISGRAIV